MITQTYRAETFTPRVDPAWSTMAAAEIPDSTLAFYYGDDKAGPCDSPRLVFVYRLGRKVRLADPSTGDMVAEFSAASKRWIADATEALTAEDAARCPSGFSGHSRRPEECRKCDRPAGSHTHGDPAESHPSWALLAFRPALPGPARCEDDSHTSEADGCALAGCAGVPPMDTFTSRPQEITAEPYPSECGSDTLGRAIVTAVRELARLGSDRVSLPVYLSSEDYARKDARHAAAYVFTVTPGAEPIDVTVISWETRSALSGWSPVWSVRVGDVWATDRDGSRVFGHKGNITWASGMLAEHVARVLGAVDAWGCRVDGWAAAPVDQAAEGAAVDESTPARPNAPHWNTGARRPGAVVVMDGADGAPVYYVTSKSDAAQYARENGPDRVLPLPAGYIVPADCDAARVMLAEDARKDAEDQAAGTYVYGTDRPLPPAPLVHTAEDAEDGYALTQCSDDVRDGDVLHVPSLRLVAVLVGAWPCAVTAGSYGFQVYTTGTDQATDDRYADRFATARAFAVAHGYRLRDGNGGNGGIEPTDQPTGGGPADGAEPTPAAEDTSTDTDTSTEETTMTTTTTPAEPTPAGPLTAKVDRAALADALAFVVKAAGRAQPVTSGVLLTPGADTLTLRVFNFEQDRSVTVAAPGVTGGPALVDVKRLKSLVDAFGKGGKRNSPESLTLTDTGSQVMVSAGNASLPAETMPVADFPAEPVPAPVLVGTIPDVAEFGTVMAAAAKAAGKDAVLPRFTAVHVTAGALLDIMVTDRYRAVFTALPIGWEPGRSDTAGYACPPAAVLTNTAAAFVKHVKATGVASPVTYALGAEPYRNAKGQPCAADWSVWQCGAYRLAVQSVGPGNTPIPMRAAIHDQAGAAGTVDAAALITAVQQIMPTLEGTAPVILTWTADAVTMSGAAGGGVTVPAVWDGTDGYPCALNPAYLIDAVNGADECGLVTIYAESGMVPHLVVDAYNSGDMLTLLMPVRMATEPMRATLETTPEGIEMTAEPTPASKPSKRTRKATPAAGPTPAAETPATPTAAEPTPAAALNRAVEAHATRAFELMAAGDFSGARAALNTAESDAPAGYLVAGVHPFSTVFGIITKRESAAAPAPVVVAEPTPAPVPASIRAIAAAALAAAPAVVVAAVTAAVEADSETIDDQAAAEPAGNGARIAVFAPVVITHGPTGTMITNTPWKIGRKIGAALRPLGWEWDADVKARILTGSAGAPVDRAAVDAAAAALVRLALTIDDQTAAESAPAVVAAPVVESAPAPVVVAEPVAEPTPTATDAAVIDAARTVGAEILASGADVPGGAVFDIPASVDTSGGYKAILKPVRQALAARGFRVSVTHVARRVTIVATAGVMTDGMRAELVSVMAEVAPAWAPALTPARVSVSA